MDTMVGIYLGLAVFLIAIAAKVILTNPPPRFPPAPPGYYERIKRINELNNQRRGR
jgi:hypothetical protein